MFDYSKEKELFGLSHELYFQIIWTIRRYDDLVTQYETAATHSVEMDGQPHGTKLSDPTQVAAISLMGIGSKITAIDKAKAEIPPEYLKGVWDSIVYRKPYPYDADTDTYRRWRRRFVWYVAFYLGEVSAP